jgi:hypothetical protein
MLNLLCTRLSHFPKILLIYYHLIYYRVFPFSLDDHRLEFCNICPSVMAGTVSTQLPFD